MTIKRTVRVDPMRDNYQELTNLLIEQMIDLGDAKMEPLGSDEMHTHKVTTILGDTYFVYAEEVDASERPGGSHHCGVVPGAVDIGVSMKDKVIIRELRAWSLLRDTLDWLGVVNMNKREELICQDLQRQIAQFLDEVDLNG